MQLEHKDALPAGTQIQESRVVAVTARKLDGYPREFQSDKRISNTEPECTATFSNGWRKKRQVTQVRREEVTGERRKRYSSQGEKFQEGMAHGVRGHNDQADHGSGYTFSS